MFETVIKVAAPKVHRHRQSIYGYFGINKDIIQFANEACIDY